jgi:hypothetical protein
MRNSMELYPGDKDYIPIENILGIDSTTQVEEPILISL